MAGLPCEVLPAYVYESNVHIGNILMTLNEQRKCGLLCDISVIVQETEFKAHKAILASCSSYFNRIITDPANVSHNIVLELSSISKVGMESLLEFAYTSKLTVNLTNIDDVINAARELEFKNIEFSCLGYLKQQLLAGKVSLCFLGTQEATSFCGNSTISRSGEQYKQAKPTECPDKKASLKTEKCLLGPKNDCPIRSMLSSFGSKKKSALVSSDERKNAKQQCGAATNPEPCEQLSQEQHQAMIKKILEQHGLEAATIDERAMEVGATETAKRSTPCYGGACGEKKLSGCLSPPYNSDTDEAGSLDGELDSSSYSMRPCGKLRKQPAIKLPFTMDEITSMPRSELHDMLTRDPNLTQEQICAIHEIRRRGKNRIAAQRCRKRKMECIRSLVVEIETLRSEHAQLMKERREAREQAIKLSDKFRAKCEKFFKCDKKSSIKKKFCGGGSTTAPPPEDQQPVLTQDELTAHNFQEHAKRAHKLCEKLKEAPTDDLPPYAMIAGGNGESSSIWSKPCVSPENEDIMCSIVDDSSDQNYQARSPSSTYVMSPSQGLGSDFGNIHISPPGTESLVLPSLSQGRTSVVQHTRSMDPQGTPVQTLPPFNTLTTMSSPLPPVALISHQADTQMTDLTRLSQSAAEQ